MTAPDTPRMLRTLAEIEQAGFESGKGKRLPPEVEQRLVQIAAPAMTAQTADEPLDAA